MATVLFVSDLGCEAYFSVNVNIFLAFVLLIKDHLNPFIPNILMEILLTVCLAFLLKFILRIAVLRVVGSNGNPLVNIFYYQIFKSEYCISSVLSGLLIKLWSSAHVSSHCM